MDNLDLLILGVVCVPLAIALVLAKWMLPRRRTAEDVLRELVEGLENGTIVFGEEEKRE